MLGVPRVVTPATTPYRARQPGTSMRGTLTPASGVSFTTSAVDTLGSSCGIPSEGVLHCAGGEGG